MLREQCFELQSRRQQAAQPGHSLPCCSWSSIRTIPGNEGSCSASRHHAVYEVCAALVAYYHTAHYKQWPSTPCHARPSLPLVCEQCSHQPGFCQRCRPGTPPIRDMSMLSSHPYPCVHKPQDLQTSTRTSVRLRLLHLDVVSLSLEQVPSKPRSIALEEAHQ